LKNDVAQLGEEKERMKAQTATDVANMLAYSTSSVERKIRV